MKLNAYRIVEMVREGINEYSTAWVQGTDLTGSFRNVDILEKINIAQQFICSLLRIRDPQMFLKSVALTGVASVYTPPADFFKLRRLESSDGIKIFPMNVDEKSSTTTGIGMFYYWKANTMILDKDAASDVLTLYYLSRVRDLDFGLSSTGGALSVTLASATARPETDYYNGMSINNWSDSWDDVISDYTSAFVATVAKTWAASKYYGIISELPESLHHLIPMKAILLMKSTYKSLKPPIPAEIADFNAAVSMAFADLLGTIHSDVDYSEMWK